MTGHFTIVEKEEIVPNVHKFVIEHPMIARRAQPGQFVLLMPTEKGERIPFTLSDWDPEQGTITLYVLELGISTMDLVELKVGDSVYSLAGPLGQPATIKHFGTVLLGGGCYGIGAIYPIAKALKAAGNHVVVIIEARSNYLIYSREALRSTVDELYVTTSDGSDGTKGHVKEKFSLLIEEGRKFDMAYFVGCTFMLMQCSEATRPLDIPTFVALNSIMVDGTGMCGCCRVTVDGKTKFVCVDGPEMDGHKVDWGELFTRKRVYHQEESISYQSHVCRALTSLEKQKGGDE